MDKLRDEIVEAQKIRADLIKWKLILVAGLGGAGIGIENTEDFPLLLCLIPFVCAYVDAAARHLNLRMHVIAHFLRESPAVSTDAWAGRYERLCKDVNASGVFGLEASVLLWSTIFLSVLVGFAGFYVHPLPELDPFPSLSGWLLDHGYSSPVFLLSSLFGVAAAIVIELRYTALVAKIAEAPVAQGTPVPPRAE